MANLLDYISNLTSADARSGQGKTVKANIKTSAYSKIVGGLGGIEKVFDKGDVLGVIQENSTAKITFPSKTGQTNVAFTKVSLNEPYFATNGTYVGYLWVQTSNIEFVNENAVVQPVAEDNESVVLEPLYATQVSGVKLRDAANLSSKYTLISYGDIVGYTDNTTKTYLTTVFWKVYSQTGKFIGYAGKGENITSKIKPQAKALPRILSDGTTEQDYANVTISQDPQSGNISASTAWWTYVLYFFGGIAILWFLISLILGKFKPKPAPDGIQR